MDVLIKRCSENMHQIYRTAPMSRCDFKKVAKQLNLIHTSGTDPFEGLRVPDEFYRFARNLFE